MAKVEQLTIKPFPPDLRWQLKALASAQKMSLNELVTSILRAIVAQKGTEK